MTITSFRTMITRPIPGTSDYHLVQTFEDPTKWGIRQRTNGRLLRNKTEVVIVGSPEEAAKVLGIGRVHDITFRPVGSDETFCNLCHAEATKVLTFLRPGRHTVHFLCDACVALLLSRIKQ